MFHEKEVTTPSGFDWKYTPKTTWHYFILFYFRSLFIFQFEFLTRVVKRDRNYAIDFFEKIKKLNMCVMFGTDYSH